MFPTPLAILIFLAPESPWWLTRKGKFEEAAKSVGRLGNKTKLQANQESVAMMRRTIDLEKDTSDPSLLELFKGVDVLVTDCLRREPHPTHASLAMALELGKRTDARTTVLTHLDKSMDYETLSTEVPDNVQVGYDGLVMTL